MKRLIPIFLLSLAGCVTPTPKEFDVEAFTIYCDSQESITQGYRYLSKNNDSVLGYQYMSGVYVMWSGFNDINGDPLPDFETLGHEVWHLVKGGFHK